MLHQLFVRWRVEGDRSAREALAEHYLPLAYKLARRYQGAREPIGDLRQVAAVGLLKSIDRFDVERPNGFVSYAIPSILGELRRYFRDCGWSVHVPRGAQEMALKVEAARRELDAKHTAVTAVLIAEYLELTVEEVSEALEANNAHHAGSLDAPTDDGEESLSIGSTIGSLDPAFAIAEKGADLARASSVLSEREREVLALRFNADMTQSEIGSQLGVSQMQVSRILRRALERLADEMAPEPAQT
jgi:RNA polymerase sigma-B factor